MLSVQATRAADGTFFPAVRSSLDGTMSLFKVVAGTSLSAFCPPHKLGSDGVVELLDPEPDTPRHCLHCAGAQVFSGAFGPLPPDLGRFADAGAAGDGGYDGALKQRRLKSSKQSSAAL